VCKRARRADLPYIPWTDQQVARLKWANLFVSISPGRPGWEAVDALARRFCDAVVAFGRAGTASNGQLDQARRDLAKVVDEIVEAAPAEAWENPTVTPEQTLADAGISDRRQARYQRRMSSPLGRGGE